MWNETLTLYIIRSCNSRGQKLTRAQFFSQVSGEQLEDTLLFGEITMWRQIISIKNAIVSETWPLHHFDTKALIHIAIIILMVQKPEQERRCHGLVVTGGQLAFPVMLYTGLLIVCCLYLQSHKISDFTKILLPHLLED